MERDGGGAGEQGASIGRVAGASLLGTLQRMLLAPDA
jgi:hypothetical protein